jgi:hypothetical protein
MTRIILPLLSFLFSTIMLGVLYTDYVDEKLKVAEAKLAHAQQMRDSLYDEIFVLKTEAARHEIAREEILTRYPKIYEEYTTFLYTETE